jgi:hypothetical protein
MLQFLKNIYKKVRNSYRDIIKRLKIFKKDLLNKIVYGPSAPLFKERIWVDPRKIEYMIGRDEILKVTGLHRSKASGVVVDWSKIDDIRPIFDEFRIQYCYEHWKNGKSWEELGVIDFMSNTKSYGSWPRQKIIARFEMLDQAFEETKKTGRLKTREEIDPSNFRESQGILVHIGENGEVFFGGNGFHRLSIAKVLELEKIPACVGIVDRDSIKSLKQFRNPQ